MPARQAAENSKLADLDLGYNEIKDDGACAIAQVGGQAGLGAGWCGVVVGGVPRCVTQVPCCALHNIAVSAAVLRLALCCGPLAVRAPFFQTLPER